jgi:hypothetical protein
MYGPALAAAGRGDAFRHPLVALWRVVLEAVDSAPLRDQAAERAVGHQAVVGQHLA